MQSHAALTVTNMRQTRPPPNPSPNHEPSRYELSLWPNQHSILQMHLAVTQDTYRVHITDDTQGYNAVGCAVGVHTLPDVCMQDFQFYASRCV